MRLDKDPQGSASQPVEKHEAPRSPACAPPAPPLSRDELVHIVHTAFVHHAGNWTIDPAVNPTLCAQVAVDALHGASALAVADGGQG